jgi:hypothetical protein
MATIKLEKLETQGGIAQWAMALFRAKVPGGWLVMSNHGTESSLAFVPDAAHAWDGNSLPQ